MTELTIDELIDRVRKDDNVERVQVRETALYEGMFDQPVSVFRTLTIALFGTGERTMLSGIENVATLHTNEAGLVNGAALNVNQPYWAVHALRAALNLND